MSWSLTSGKSTGSAPFRPLAWREVRGAILEYLVSKTTMDETLAADVQALTMLPKALDAVSNQDPHDGDEAWPIMLVFRNSETAMYIRDTLLHDKFKSYLGKAHDMGVRPAQQQYGGAQRAVLEGLGKEGEKAIMGRIVLLSEKPLPAPMLAQLNVVISEPSGQLPLMPVLLEGAAPLGWYQGAVPVPPFFQLITLASVVLSSCTYRW